MDKPLPGISATHMNRSWNGKRIGIVVTLVLLVVAGAIVVSSLLAPSPTPSVTANRQWKPVVANFDGVEMVLVPPGCFLMGSTQEQIDALNQRHPAGNNAYSSASRNFFNAEGPQHRVCFDQPFWLDRYDVTNAQFDHFHGGETNAQFDHLYGLVPKHSNWTGPNRPVDSILQPEADNFCVKRGARLPTAAEWEYAARGPDDLIYPWGNDFVPDNVVYAGNSNHETADVGSKPGGVSWVGAYDMSGNVWQWTSRDDFLRGDMITNDPTVRKGGAYHRDADFLRSATRGTFDMNFMYGDPSGFRCARSYDASVQPILAATIGAAQGSRTSFPTVTANSQWNPVVQAFDNVAMVLVPTGCFTMGSASGGPNDERPTAKICFDKPFWLDQYDVTNAQFAQFKGVAAQQSHFADDPFRPRESITWFEARDFCAKRGARLPTEAEWEYAARGPDDLVYPWGNDFTPGNVSWVGAYDMSGTVWQWVSTLYRPFPYNATDGRESNTDASSGRVLRGGSWYNYRADLLRSALRFSGNPDSQDLGIGFRCARSYILTLVF